MKIIGNITNKVVILTNATNDIYCKYEKYILIILFF